MRLFAEKKLIYMSRLAKIFTILMVFLITGCAKAPRDSHPLLISSAYAKTWQELAARRQLGPVFIDPGHGGKDRGAESRLGLLEKRLNLETAFALQTALIKQRLPTQLSRQCDRFVSLDQRARLANDKRSLLLISLHYNWAPNTKAHGIEIFYPRQEFGKERSLLSQALAEAVLLQLKLRGFSTSRGVKAAGFSVLRQSLMPAILIEGGFLSNEAESRQLNIAKRRKLMALSVASGIEEFLKKTHTRPKTHQSPYSSNLRVQRPQRADGR